MSTGARRPVILTPSIIDGQQVISLTMIQEVRCTYPVLKTSGDFFSRLRNSWGILSDWWTGFLCCLWYSIVCQHTASMLGCLGNMILIELQKCRFQNSDYILQFHGSSLEKLQSTPINCVDTTDEQTPSQYLNTFGMCLVRFSWLVSRPLSSLNHLVTHDRRWHWTWYPQIWRRCSPE
jgi:hypothetical protein